MAIVGWLATVLTAGWAVPQWLRLAKHDPDGVAVETYAFGFASALGWLGYGVAVASLPVEASSAAVALVYAAIVTRLVARGATRWLRPVSVSASWGALLVAAASFGGADALGLVLAAAALVVNGPQVVDSLRAPALTGVSPAAWLLAFLEGVLWGVYGVGLASSALVAYGIVQVSSSGIVLVRTVAVGPGVGHGVAQGRAGSLRPWPITPTTPS